MPNETGSQRWQRLKRAIADEPLPCALIDLDALEKNARFLNGIANEAGKTLRLATKSIRCPALLRRLLNEGAPTLRGLMTYTASETAFLAKEGFDDFFLAYPTAQESDAEILATLTQNGTHVVVVADSVEQLKVLSAKAQARSVRVKIALEIDLSFRPAGGAVHLGGRRSPLHSAEAVLALANAAKALGGVEVYGVMGYEGHIAGVTDKNPFTPWMNHAKRTIKRLSRRSVERGRAEVAAALKAAGHELRVFNGGGTGSLRWASQEPALTEVTAGSGYLASHLFSYYRDYDLTPAAYFALQVVRKPAPGMVTCLGGGYVASGEAGRDRLPVPALPEGGHLLDLEGAGEVQTPVVLGKGVELHVGEPYFFRHAKAGELAEHFSEYLLVRGDQVEARVKTYRGLGQCFLG